MGWCVRDTHKFSLCVSACKKIKIRKYNYLFLNSVFFENKKKKSKEFVIRIKGRVFFFIYIIRYSYSKTENEETKLNK